MNKPKKKGRDLAYTINELMDSPRLKIAVASFKKDPMLLKAIFTELGMEAESVAKYSVIRCYQQNEHLDRSELLPLLRAVGTINSDSRNEDDIMVGMPKKEINEMNTYNIWWGIGKSEVKLYLANLNPDLSDEDRQALIDEVKSKFGLI